MLIDVSSWGWPQWTVVVVYAVLLLIEAIEHGKPKSRNYNFMALLVILAIWLSVLGFGGFWG